MSMTRPYIRLGIGVAAASAVAAPAMALAAASPSAHPALRTRAAHAVIRTSARTATATKVSAQARLGSAVVAGDLVTVRGSVALTPNTAAERAKLRVVVKLAGIGGSERYVLSVNAADAFSKTFTTQVTGTGTLALRAELSGRATGTQVTKSVAIAASATTTSTTATTTTPIAAGTSPITTTTPIANEVPLVGTFEIGTGSSFEMFTPGGVIPVPPGNLSLTAGSDGGLETFGYQAAPVPAFDAKNNALAARIIRPLPFDGTNFSVDTQPTDVQTATADPVPAIFVNALGQLSGQVTAWDAQWNRQNFNQGTPKPNGTSPGATTKLSGTYNWATGAYSITWKSLIVGGPFSNFIGVWHLAGTFDPATFS